MAQVHINTSFHQSFITYNKQLKYKHACISYVLTVVHWSKKNLPIFWFPSKWKISYWITWEVSNHSVFVNPTIHNPGMCTWRTIAIFHYLFHFQSSKPQGISLCCIVTSILLAMWLMWSIMSGSVCIKRNMQTWFQMYQPCIHLEKFEDV